jgi:hypothetical protein
MSLPQQGLPQPFLFDDVPAGQGREFVFVQMGDAA